MNGGEWVSRFIWLNCGHSNTVLFYGLESKGWDLDSMKMLTIDTGQLDAPGKLASCKYPEC